MPSLNDDDREQVARIHHEARLARAEIEADAGLSDQGKAEAIDASEAARQKQLDVIYETADKRAEREGRAAYREAFGLPAGSPGTMSMASWDAADRIANVSAVEASRLLNEALLRGDQTMAKAIGERAFREAGPSDLGGQWGRVLEVFAASSPARQRAIGVMAGHRADAMSTAAIHDRFLRQLPRRGRR